MTDFSDTHLNGVTTPTSPNGHHGFDFGNITSSSQKHAQEPSPAPQSSLETPPRSATSNGMLTNGVVDFFSPEVFQIVLHNPATAHQLLKFSQARLSGENMEFLERVRCRKKKRAITKEALADEGI